MSSFVAWSHERVNFFFFIPGDLRNQTRGVSKTINAEATGIAVRYERVVVMDAGKVVEVGTYQELTGRPGLLQHLLAQAGLTG